MSPRAGRRPGSTRTRDDILTAARTAFAATGFEATTVRAVATRAGVDAAMINHHFGSKRGLFLAALQLPVDPAAEVATALAGPRSGLGERVVRRLLEVWDGAAGSGGTAVFRTALQDEATGAMVRGFVVSDVLGPILHAAGVAGDELNRRSALVAAQLSGLILTRYLLRLPAAVEAEPAELVAAVGPTIQRYLTGRIV